MKSLVIGSEGFIGRPLCGFLRSLGGSVIGLDFRKSVDEDARFCELDLDEVDCVYFLAWEVGGAKYLYRKDTQLRQVDNNVKLMQNVFRQVGKRGVPFVFASSRLSGSGDLAYGLTKAMGEWWTRLCGGVVLRLWNVYGPMEPMSERSHVVSDFVRQAVDAGEIRMRSSGEELRGFVHIDDVCRAFDMASRCEPGTTWGVFPENEIRVIDVARAIAELTGAKVFPGELRMEMPSAIPTSSISLVPGWNPSIGFLDGIKNMVDSYKKGNLP